MAWNWPFGMVEDLYLYLLWECEGENNLSRGLVFYFCECTNIHRCVGADCAFCLFSFCALQRCRANNNPISKRI